MSQYAKDRNICDGVDHIENGIKVWCLSLARYEVRALMLTLMEAAL